MVEKFEKKDEQEVHVQEVEINLQLINSKLNYIIDVLTELKQKSK